MKQLSDAKKVKILFGMFAANQVMWLVMTERKIKAMNKIFDEQSARFKTLHEFTGIVLDVVAREKPSILWDKEIDDFVMNDKFERIVKDI